MIDTQKNVVLDFIEKQKGSSKPTPPKPVQKSNTGVKPLDTVIDRNKPKEVKDIRGDGTTKMVTVRTDYGDVSYPHKGGGLLSAEILKGYREKVEKTMADQGFKKTREVPNLVTPEEHVTEDEAWNKGLELVGEVVNFGQFGKNSVLNSEPIKNTIDAVKGYAKVKAAQIDQDLKPIKDISYKNDPRMANVVSDTNDEFGVTPVADSASAIFDKSKTPYERAMGTGMTALNVAGAIEGGASMASKLFKPAVSKLESGLLKGVAPKAEFNIAPKSASEEGLPHTFRKPAPKSGLVKEPFIDPKAPEAGAQAAQSTTPDLPIEKPVGELTSFAKQVTGRDSLHGTNVKEIVKAGEDAINSGRINPTTVVDRMIQKGGSMTPEEIGATNIELRKIRNRQKAIENTNATDAVENKTLSTEWDTLQAQAEKILQAGDLAGNDWHKVGIALQTALKEDMSLGSLKSRAKAANYGNDVEGLHAKKLEEVQAKYDEATAELEKIKSGIVGEIQKMEPKAPRLAVASREKARSVAKDYFEGQRMGGGGLGSNRQRGAVKYTATNDEMRAKSAIRKLAKEISLDGAKDLDAVLDGIRKEIGVNVKDDDLLRMISEPYSKYRIEADVAVSKANKALDDVKRAADFRMKSVGGKAWSVFNGLFNGVQRSFNLGADFSAPFIQGRKAIANNPAQWFKSFKPMFQASLGKRSNEFALKHLANIEAHPMYAKAKAAGLEIQTPGGKFTQQEEMYAGNLGTILEAMERNKGIKRLAGAPLEAHLNILERSELAFTTYMNDLRFNEFQRMAKVAPNDPAYLRDVSQLINVIYGRGHGDLARFAGKTGNVFLAPRYLTSQIQFTAGVPIFKAETAAGRRQAMAAYAKYTAAVGGLVYSAKLAGWDAGLDPRSSDFGKISKDGKTIDIFGKEGQFIKLGMMGLYGKINQGGKYTPPSSYSSNQVGGQFLQGKLGPLWRTASEATMGVYDEAGTRPLNIDDAKLRFAPLWVQDAIKDSKKWKGKEGEQKAAVLANIFGLEIKPRDIAKTKVPLDIKKPGIYRKN